jgi:short-subunit dehydrogenase
MKYNRLWKTLAVIGGIKISCDIFPWVYWKLFCRLDISAYKDGYVVITDSSSRLGKSLAKTLLQKDLKLILLSPNPETLPITKESLLKSYPNSTIHTYSSSLLNSHRNPQSFYDDLDGFLAQYPISILINNIETQSNKFIDSQSLEELELLIGLNVYPSTLISHLLIPKFLKRKELGRRSLVLSTCSVLEENVFPGTAVLSATKRYNFFFNQGLRYEYDHIDFAIVKLGLDELLGNKQTFGVDLDYDNYADALINNLRTGTNYGNFKIKLFSVLLKSVPYIPSVLAIRVLLPFGIKAGIIKLK